jgi:hypothetical protein
MIKIITRTLSFIAFNVQEIQIHPFVPSAQHEVPSLKHTVAPPPKYLPKTIKHENKPVVPRKDDFIFKIKVALTHCY